MTEECPVAFEWTRMVCLCLLGNILRDINRHVLAVPVLDEGVLLAQKAVKRHGDERDEWGRARAAAALRMMDEKLKNSRELVSKNKEPAECGDNEGDMRPWVLLPIN
jgi:hypothetical protein